MTVHTPTSAAVEFPQLACARPRPQWWAGLMTGLLGLAFYGVLLVLLIVAVIVLAAIDVRWADEMEVLLASSAYFDLDRPWLFLALVIPLILMIPALFAASRIVQGRGVGLLSSVAGRVRWGWLCRTLGLAAALFAACFGVLLGASAVAGDGIAPDFSHPSLWVMVVLVLLLIPFQAAAEEYVFRSYLMQLIGRWLRHPAFAILLPVPLFVLGHGYDIWGATSVGVFAAVAGWLCWRTGGIEAAVSLHIVNNVVIFLLGAVSLADPNATSGGLLDLLAATVTTVVFALVADRWASRLGLGRSRPLPQPEVSAGLGGHHFDSIVRG